MSEIPLQSPCFKGMTVAQFLDRVNQYYYSFIEPATIAQIRSTNYVCAFDELNAVLKRAFRVWWIKPDDINAIYEAITK